MSKVGNCKEFFLTILKKPILYFCVAFIVVNLFFTKQIMETSGADGFLFVAIIEIVVECLSVFILVKMRKKGMPLEKQFLFLAIMLGVLFIGILPPGQSPDETTHFKRAYGISGGILIPDEKVNSEGAIGSDIPVTTDFFERTVDHGTYAEIVNQIGLGTDESSPQPYTSAALYNFVCYIPQSFAALIGRALHLSVLAMAYLMEIFNFIVWVLLVYFAIKLLPKFKSFVLFVALLPITLQEATSLAPDALTIGLSMFFVSYVLHLAYVRKGTLGKKQMAILTISSIVLGFCKIVYLPLTLLMLIIPKEKFGTKKKKWIFLGALFTVVAILNFVWLLISSRYLISYRDGVDSKEQLMGVIKNPFNYIATMARTTWTNAKIWVTNMLGFSLGALIFNLPRALLVLSSGIFILLLGQRDETLKVKKFDRTIFIIVFITIIGFIFTSLYMQWTAVGAPEIEGIQGRYFLPILMLLPLIICRTKAIKKYPTIISEKIVLYFSLFINIIALVTIFAKNI